jgi:hypothetical protein
MHRFFDLKKFIVADYKFSERAYGKNDSGLDLHEKKKVQINGECSCIPNLQQ